jgi:hypothetical protein
VSDVLAMTALELAVRRLIEEWGEGRISGDRAMLMLAVLVESDATTRPASQDA